MHDELVEHEALVERVDIGREDLQPLTGERAGEPMVVELISTLLNEGFENQFLLSQDVCHDSQLASYGGNGYTYLQKSFLPQLAAAGVNAATIKTITVENPARLLTLRSPA
jgi:phosphotriesterase-related protein